MAVTCPAASQIAADTTFAVAAKGVTNGDAHDHSGGDGGALSNDLSGATYAGTATLPTPFNIAAVSMTATGTQLNYLNAATGTTGTTSTNVVFSTSPVLTTPSIGVATGTSLAATGLIKSSSATTGIGYATGAGNAVTQLTNKSTTVTIDAICGTITTHNAQLNAGIIVTFQVTCSAMAATDVVIMNHDSGGTISAYTINPNGAAAGHFHVTIKNTTAGNLSEALVLRYAIIKAVIS
jgi:hypothetical protein